MNGFLYVAVGAVPGENITYPSFQLNNPYISVGCKTHLRKRLSMMWDTHAQKKTFGSANVGSSPPKK